MTDDLALYASAIQQNRDQQIGASDVGDCYRQHAARYFGVPISNVQPTDKADFGTLLHLGWTAMIRSTHDPAERDADVPIVLEELPRPVRADDVDYEHKVVSDLKTMSDRAWNGSVNRGSPYEKAWDQLEVYAEGLRRQHGGEWTLRVVAINRETGERAFFERDADPEQAKSLLNKAQQRHEAILLSIGNGGEWTDFQREGSGPGRGMPCDYCDWLDVCWPDAEAPRSPQSESIAEDPDVIAVYVADYKEAAAEESKAKARKEDARAFLSGLVGVYGDWEIKWSGGREKDPVPDCDAMVEILTAINVEIPLKHGGYTNRSIRVVRA